MKKALSDALEKRGYETLTPVQVAVTEPELVGQDLLVSAQTGSGKTLGFGLAIAPTLLEEAESFPRAGSPLALIIAPTRELALQVKRELSWLYDQAGAVVASCVGGMDMRDERRSLQRGAHIVVATPGRLRDHIMRNSIDLSEIKAVVLDEADEMLDLGFREDLEFILGEAPEERQTLLFSATVPQQIAKLAKSYQKNAVRVSTTAEKSQHADIEYKAMRVSPRDGENAIINVLRYFEAPNAIVFCNTRAMVNRITTRLSNRGFSVVALSGELSQNERTHALQAMRDGRARVCVATDVAARGIDLPNLDLVVHAELPSNHETLLHRSGRTGRAGRKGTSTLIVPPASRKKAERILNFAKLKAEWVEAPSAEAVAARDEERMLADPSWTTEIAESEATTVQAMVEQFSAEQIAAAFLRLYRSNHTAPEELGHVDEKPKPREAFGPSVWFSVSGGHAAEAEPRRLLPMLCKAGGLSKDDIGAIRVQPEESFVEIRKASVDAFLKEIGPDMKVEDGVLTQLKTPPVVARGSRPGFGGKPQGRGGAGDRPRKPRARDDAPKSYDDKPRVREDTAPRPASTKPVDWNDESAPRRKKPKPGAPGAKPRKPEGARRDPVAEGVVVRRKPDSAKPKGAGFSKPSSRGGPKPPVGKPSSKKNKARSGDKPTPRGGFAVPRRGKPS